MFGTETECMREQDAADIRPYALESGWLGFVPGVKTTDLTLEESRPAVFGADDLSDPWSNPIIQRIQAGFNPLLIADSAYWRLNDLPGPNGQWPNGRYPQTLVYGQTVNRLLTVFNDTFSNSPINLRWQARLGSPDGPRVSQGSETLEIAPGTDLQVPLTFTAPIHGTTMYLVLSSSINGRQIFQERHEVFDLAAQAAAPLVTDDNSVSNPAPTTLAAAADGGQTDIEVASTNGLTANTQVTIDSGADQESATIKAIGTDGTDITLAAALRQSHDAGATVTPAPANDKWSYSTSGSTRDWSSGSNFLDGGNIPRTIATGSPAGIPISTFSSSAKANATATLRFVGTKISLYGWTALNYGIASISIDGGAPITFDEGPANPDTLLLPAGATPASTPGANPSQIPNGVSVFGGFFGGYSQAVPMYTSPQLRLGLHTLVVAVTGTHDATATGSTVAIDSAIASEPTATDAGAKQ